MRYQAARVEPAYELIDRAVLVDIVDARDTLLGGAGNRHRLVDRLVGHRRRALAHLFEIGVGALVLAATAEQRLFAARAEVVKQALLGLRTRGSAAGGR